jgi:hypothetical protein
MDFSVGKSCASFTFSTCPRISPVGGDARESIDTREATLPLATPKLSGSRRIAPSLSMRCVVSESMGSCLGRWTRAATSFTSASISAQRSVLTKGCLGRRCVLAFTCCALARCSGDAVSPGPGLGRCAHERPQVVEVEQLRAQVGDEDRALAALRIGDAAGDIAVPDLSVERIEDEPIAVASQASIERIRRRVGQHHARDLVQVPERLPFEDELHVQRAQVRGERAVAGGRRLPDRAFRYHAHGLRRVGRERG